MVDGLIDVLHIIAEDYGLLFLIAGIITIVFGLLDIRNLINQLSLIIGLILLIIWSFGFVTWLEFLGLRK